MTHKVEMTTFEALLVANALRYWFEESDGHQDDKRICIDVKSRIDDQIAKELSGR